ncbi:MAG: site-specific integrase [Prevotella nigrescens]|uniref:Site-specific integrase n=1 Tax=Prevotella nigrescens TaxID=28133 RepID=A0A9D5WWS0_9BACT|nr:site-specific integrase [Prevotella nigrescens]MBF1447705.1 site-specific integrase [Prevotella nigrescens]
MKKRCTRVSVLQRPITNGMLSLYIDFYPAVRNPYTMKLTRREYLGIYIYANPINDYQHNFNISMLNKAEIIRCRRTEAFINNDLGIFDYSQQSEDFLAFYKKECRPKDKTWDIVYDHFYEFTHGKCTFGEVTLELCNKFKDYLLSMVENRELKRPICQNTAAAYWCTFRALLKIAYKHKFIKENLNDFLDKIEKEDVRKEYLTLDELKHLANTPCKIPILKSASLFSCLTGLRISDVLNLKWENIELAPEGGYCMRIKTIKTGTVATLPISNEAYELCGTPCSEGTVFKGFKRNMTGYYLQQWLKEAGITKHISFHCFRHTFATLQIAQGTDIYTVSKMLTHRNVSTTQIYADLVSSKKRESANKISLK